MDDNKAFIEVEYYYTYPTLVNKDSLPPEVKIFTRESYLSPEDFQKVFGISKEAFAKLPKWRRVDKKKKANLFWKGISVH